MPGLGQWKVKDGLAPSQQTSVLSRLAERKKELRGAISLSKDYKNADGIPVKPSTAQTLRTRATKDLRDVSLVFELLELCKAHNITVELSEHAKTALQYLMYPIKRS